MWLEARCTFGQFWTTEDAASPRDERSGEEWRASNESGIHWRDASLMGEERNRGSFLGSRKNDSFGVVEGVEDTVFGDPLVPVFTEM